MAKRNYGNTNSMKKGGGWTFNAKIFFPSKPFWLLFTRKKKMKKNPLDKNKQTSDGMQKGAAKPKSLSGAARLLGSVSRFLASQVSLSLSLARFSIPTHTKPSTIDSNSLSLLLLSNHNAEPSFLLTTHTRVVRFPCVCDMHSLQKR